MHKCPKDNTWIINLTGDELPTTWFFDNIRTILDGADQRQIDRMGMTVYHLRGEYEISAEIGGQLRIFRNDSHHNCVFTDAPHERLHGKFDGHFSTHEAPGFAFVHFRQADPTKIQLWKTHYVEKGVYSAWDINRRLKIPTIELPQFITYKINNELRKYLKW